MVWAGIIRLNAITVNIVKATVNTDRITKVNTGRIMDTVDLDCDKCLFFDEDFPTA